MATPFTISEPTQAELDGSLPRHLRAFNARFLGEYTPLDIRFNARDEKGNTVGGIRSELTLGWLFVHVLWVHDDWRRKNIGSMLLQKVEQEAIAKGASTAELTTFEFQAPRFYVRHGYRETRRIENRASGYYLAAYQKDF